MKKTILLVLVLVLGLAMATLAQAATIAVGPGASYDFGTIQEAIDVAKDGYTVLVHGRCMANRLTSGVRP